MSTVQVVWESVSVGNDLSYGKNIGQHYYTKTTLLPQTGVALGCPPAWEEEKRYKGYNHRQRQPHIPGMTVKKKGAVPSVHESRVGSDKGEIRYDSL